MAKEHFTNDHLEFTDQIKRELLAPAGHGVTQVVYMVFAELPYERFAIHYVKGETNNLCIRFWNDTLDKVRFSLGIYNLDRIAIKESKIELSSSQVKMLDNLANIKPVVTEFRGVILDGYAYQLTLCKENQQTYEWRHHSQIDSSMKKLLDKLVEFAQLS